MAVSHFLLNKMIRSACLIFNPVAGQSDPDEDLALIKQQLSLAIDLDIKFTSETIDADQLAKQAVASNVEAIIASGGDGTISAVAEAVINTNIPLGIIARGTANAFANALGIPDHLPEACRTILAEKTITIDTGLCNGKPMILLAGIGLEAETVAQTNRQAKNHWGMLAYILSGWQKIQELNQFQAQIETDEQVFELTAAAVTIANAAPFTSILAQGTSKIIPDDGLLDLTIFAPTNPLDAIAASSDLFLTALQQEAVNKENIYYLRTKRTKITTNPPQKVALDGDIICTTPVEIQCVPQSLVLFVPPN